MNIAVYSFDFRKVKYSKYPQTKVTPNSDYSVQMTAQEPFVLTIVVIYY